MERAPQFSIPVADLEHGERDIDEPIPVEWLVRAFEGSEATPSGEPGRLEVTVSKSGRDVMVRGHALATVALPCARTLDPARYELKADLFLLLGPAPAAFAPSGGRKMGARGAPARSAEGARTTGPRGAAAARKTAARETAPKAPTSAAGRGRARKEEPDLGLAEDEAARDTYDGERVVLDPFVREFLLLELPMFPLREDLRSEATPAIDGPPIGPADPGPETPSRVDPRLAPLAALKSRLREKKE